MKLASIESKGIDTLAFLKALNEHLNQIDNNTEDYFLSNQLDVKLLSDLLKKPVTTPLIRRVMREINDDHKSGTANFTFWGFSICKEKLEEFIWELKEEEKEEKLIMIKINTINGDHGHIGEGDHCTQKEK